jgi:hypothetical protein
LSAASWIYCFLRLYYSLEVGFGRAIAVSFVYIGCTALLWRINRAFSGRYGSLAFFFLAPFLVSKLEDSASVEQRLMIALFVGCVLILTTIIIGPAREPTGKSQS